MQVHESLNMDTSTTFSQSRGCKMSRKTVILFIIIFIGSLIATGFVVYNLVACPQVKVSSTICNHHYSTNTPTINPTNSVNKILQEEDPNELGDDMQTTPIIHDNKTDVRLPRSIKPLAYNIVLIPFLLERNFTFFGTVRIIIQCVENTNNITLHATSLKIKDEDVTVTSDGIQLSIIKLYSIKEKQFFIIEFDKELLKDNLYEINIKYTGVLNDYLQGFYRSSYSVGNEIRWLATTQFQPTDARRAFPCFDEPALKAKFNLTIARPTNMTSISNMPRIGKPIPVKGLPLYVWDVYQESVPMSTYLVAFVVSDFVNQTSGNFAVWTRVDAIKSASYALEVGPKILKFLEQFFGIDYPLPKVDMIALPDFSAGAMENWGLITYRETAMLYDEGVSASSNKQRVATVVAHELAHQWFGNLVTPAWWSDLWLNEGFASYMEYLGVNAVEPTWKSMDQFVVNELQNVFALDALSSSHQISVEVGNPDEINEIFDRISYGKGATIIRMMDHFLTTNVFKGGLSNYLKDKAYQSAEQDDLWEFLTQEARYLEVFDNSTTVKKIMDTWTLQTGFPVVTITRSYNNDDIELKQSRFIYIESKNKTATIPKQDPIWWIPITYTTLNQLNFNNTRPSYWMRGTRELTIRDIVIPHNHWIIVNIQQTGYYRVNYDISNWQMIISHLRLPRSYTDIAPTNRAQLIDDALNLARGGLLSYEIALDVTRYLEHETDYVPWKAAINSLTFIDSMLMKGGEYHKFKEYFLKLLEKIYDDVGFEDTKTSDMLTVYKRVDVLNTACHLGSKSCIYQSIIKYQSWMQEPNPEINNPISPNLKNVVYCTAIKYGDQQEWDFAWERFLKTTVSSEKEILLSALGCSRETWILTRYLERAMSENLGIRKQDVFRVFGAVSSNVLGQPITFNYIRNNWDYMKEFLGQSMSNLNTILKYATRRLNNKYELDELKRFAELNLKDSGRTIQQVIERAEVNIDWMDNNYKTIVDWLTKVTGLR